MSHPSTSIFFNFKHVPVWTNRHRSIWQVKKRHFISKTLPNFDWCLNCIHEITLHFLWFNFTGFQSITISVTNFLHWCIQPPLETVPSTCMTVWYHQLHNHARLSHSSSSEHVLPRLRTKRGEGAFSFARPHIWNLFIKVCSWSWQSQHFKQWTHLFTLTFNNT